ncbi:sensor histidine kinase [Paenibacillus sp. LMG 31456]|uniref:Circadian input-output histidine kinase CikA n=1 Tax=Paenibacillus foliorum TaxID=2654974 RepID=A0A972GZU2_9BACL|nr:ATP-binding protein [Paenibacillus foliorum]NOU93601.1 sensor histidine kinase [Paenibacillus foliorum]
MEYAKVFIINISILTTLTYTAMLVHKYLLSQASGVLKYALSVLLAIGAGWLTMVYSFDVGPDIKFDLRFLPLIICTLVYSNPITLLVIGVGIGVARLTFGLQSAAWAGCLNMVLLGVLCVILNILLKKVDWSFWAKITVVILAVNLANCVNVALLGTIQIEMYVSQIVPAILPASILLSFFYMFMLSDFHLERRRVADVQIAHDSLQRQTEQLIATRKILEEKAHQLMLSSQYKSEFLANMSHELRTPLNSIIALSQFISDADKQEDGSETAEYAAIIHSSGQELLRLIDDILDLSKVEAGRMEILNEEVIISEITYVMEYSFRHIAEQKGLEFAIQEEPELPSLIHTDALRLQQILRNLLSNAFKFTAHGSVILRVWKPEPRDEGLSGEWVAFSVSDTGIGIPEKMQEPIFEAFQQADGSISRQYGGTGLGLSISRALTGLLGGRLKLSSTAGKGSTFTLYLPIR